MRFFARFIFWVWGWKLNGGIPEGINKCVIIQAPHTSMRDFVMGWLASKILGERFSFIIKKEAFFFPLGYILKAMGGIPVDRSHSMGTVKQVVEVFGRSSKLYLVITPEGTRKRTTRWKRGFYYIAQTAQVPVLLGYLDYKRKICGIGGQLTISGDFEADFKKVEDFYRGMQGRHKGMFNLE